MILNWRFFQPIVLLSYFTVQSVLGVNSRPNIVIIMADDLGFDDVSFRGSNEFLTPNIDALAYNGVILNRYYVPAMCTPSRSSLLTGKHPINTGMQHYVIANEEPWGLPLTEKTMAQFFKEAGYNTSIIGKWHLGFASKAYTPLLRGFDHHYGYLGAFIDYYDQTLISSRSYAKGHDFRNNLNVHRENQGEYVTDSLTREAVRLITSHDTKNPLLLLLNHLAPHAANEDHPFQAPEEEIAKFNYIADPERRIYAAMVSKLDESIGKVVDTLNTKGILNNTIIVFYSDNGAPTQGLHANKGSNYPFRGQKGSPWEGGIRSSAAIWSTRLQKRGTIWDQTMHAMDWLPTLASAANIKLDNTSSLDGLDMWTNLTTTQPPSPRKLLQNIDEIFNFSAYSSGPWKFVNGTTSSGKYDGWLGARNYSFIDPRASHYVQTIKKSNTWKSLSPYSRKHVTDIDIEKIREKADIKCIATREISRCEPLKDECIFNTKYDPCEQVNLINEMRNSEILKTIRAEISELRKNAKKPQNKPSDPTSDPRHHNDEWTWWMDH